MKKYFDLFAACRLFDGFSPEELSEIAEHLSPTERAFQKGEYIYQYGEPITTVGLLLAGRGHILKEDYWGNRAILAEISAGELFGEAYACFGEQKLMVSVQAAEACSVLFFDTRTLLDSCAEDCGFHHRIIRNLIGVLAEKNIRLTEKIEYMSRKRLRDKILSYLSDAAKKQGGLEFTIPFNRQELADYLSVDRSALSSELCRLRDEKLLDFHRNHFRLFLP